MELGNSAGIFLRHYRELVHKDQATKFWDLYPDRKQRKAAHSPASQFLVAAANPVKPASLSSQQSTDDYRLPALYGPAVCRTR